MRRIAAEEAEYVMPSGVADAGLVDDAINDLRTQNEDLRAITDIQRQQIDLLNESVSDLERTISELIDHHNAELH